MLNIYDGIFPSFTSKMGLFLFNLLLVTYFSNYLRKLFGWVVKLENNVPLFSVKVDDKVKMSHLVTIASHHIGKHL